MPKLKIMQEHVKSAVTPAPILFPFEPLQYWETIRQIIREEVNNAEPKKQAPFSFETPGLTNKPIYKIAEVCKLSRLQSLPFMIGYAMEN